MQFEPPPPHVWHVPAGPHAVPEQQPPRVPFDDEHGAPELRHTEQAPLMHSYCGRLQHESPPPVHDSVAWMHPGPVPLDEPDPLCEPDPLPEPDPSTGPASEKSALKSCPHAAPSVTRAATSPNRATDRPTPGTSVTPMVLSLLVMLVVVTARCSAG